MDSSRRWQRNSVVLEQARVNMWPAGEHHLGVHWMSGLEWNKAELNRRIAAGEFSAAQCLSRLTDGMPNFHGPINGPGRPTLATKWKQRVSGASAEDIDAHVAALREHVARQVAQRLGLLHDGDAATKKRGADDAARSAPTPAPKRARTQGGEAAATWACGLRIQGKPGDPTPSGHPLTTKIFVAKANSVQKNQQEQLARIKKGELSVDYALSCMRDGGPLRRNWGAAADAAVRQHIDALCKFLREIKEQARAGTYA